MARDTIQQPARSHSRRISLFVIIGACWCFASCSARTPNQLVEAPPASPAPQAPTEQAQHVQQSTPPNLNKVQAAVKRIFKDAALIDTSRKPSFVTGDFNGDLSEDLAVVLTPVSGKLSEINEEFPPWILKDPFTPNEPGMKARLVAENELLLAVVHGFGPDGWNDPQATQTYLLRNVVGTEMQAHSGSQFLALNRGKSVPRVSGDMIGEKLKGTSGYLYYASATYSWYDPKTFKGESRQSAGHAAAPRPGQEMSRRLAPSGSN